MALFMFGFIGLPPAGHLPRQVLRLRRRHRPRLDVAGHRRRRRHGRLRLLLPQRHPRDVHAAARARRRRRRRLAAARPSAGRRRGRRLRARRCRELRLRRARSSTSPRDAVAPPLRSPWLDARSESSSSARASRAKLRRRAAQARTPRPRSRSSSTSSLGGECSYWACIPSKTLLRPLEVLAPRAARPGRSEAVTAVDAARRLRLARRGLREGRHEPGQVARRSRGAELVRGTASSPSRASSRSASASSPTTRSSSRPARCPPSPPIEGLDDVPHWASREATSASAVPESLAVVGGGAVGCELAQLYARLGAKVTLVQGGPRLLPQIDAEVAALLADRLRRGGHRPPPRREGDRASRAAAASRSAWSSTAGSAVEAERLLVATGRRPNVEGFGLEHLDLTFERKGIVVDEPARGRRERLGGRRRHGRRPLHPRGQVPGAHRRGERRRRRRARRLPRRPGRRLHRPAGRVAGDTSGEGAVTSTWQLESVSRTATFQRPKQPGFLKLFADPERGVLVGAARRRPRGGRVDRPAHARDPRRGPGGRPARHDPAVPDLLRGRVLRRPRPGAVASHRMTERDELVRSLSGLALFADLRDADLEAIADPDGSGASARASACSVAASPASGPLRHPRRRGGRRDRR